MELYSKYDIILSISNESGFIKDITLNNASTANLKRAVKYRIIRSFTPQSILLIIINTFISTILISAAVFLKP